MYRWKDCKIDGPVGGEKSIPLSSLEFQIQFLSDIKPVSFLLECVLTCLVLFVLSIFFLHEDSSVNRVLEISFDSTI